jgi:hypothetical protein
MVRRGRVTMTQVSPLWGRDSSLIACSELPCFEIAAAPSRPDASGRVAEPAAQMSDGELPT